MTEIVTLPNDVRVDLDTLPPGEQLEHRLASPATTLQDVAILLDIALDYYLDLPSTPDLLDEGSATATLLRTIARLVPDVELSALRRYLRPEELREFLGAAL